MTTPPTTTTLTTKTPQPPTCCVCARARAQSSFPPSRASSSCPPPSFTPPPPSPPPKKTSATPTRPRAPRAAPLLPDKGLSPPLLFVPSPRPGPTGRRAGKNVPPTHARACFPRKRGSFCKEKPSASAAAASSGCRKLFASRESYISSRKGFVQVFDGCLFCSVARLELLLLLVPVAVAAGFIVRGRSGGGGWCGGGGGVE
jgi:hypothetical protein